MTGSTSRPGSLFMRIVCSLAMLAGLASCAWMRNDPGTRPLIAPDRIGLANDIHLARDGWPGSRWWTRYADAQLDALVERGLGDSPNMRVARARIEQARADVERAQAATQFQAALIGRVSQQWSKSISSSSPLTDPIPDPEDGGYNSGAHSGTVSSIGISGGYEFDLWGMKRSAVAAAIGARNAMLAEAATAELEISTTIARTYFSLQAVMQQIVHLQQIRDILRDSNVAMTARQARGFVTSSTTAKTKDELLKIEQVLASMQAQEISFREVLRALTGAGADDFPLIAMRPLPEPQPQLPATLSYALLSHRPDLVALRWYVQSSFDQIDVAKAAFYPNFDIKALLGITSIRIEDVLNVTSLQFRLMPGVSLPIFDGGRLNANLRKTRAASNTLIEQYNQAVLGAVRDVAIAATNMQNMEDQARIEWEKSEQAQIGEEEAGARAQRGLASAISAREAQIPVLNAQVQMADICGKRLAAEIALIKALGGGYDTPAMP
ncbi:efflux transporter outer membrane subunit [Burkholderia sp. BCC0322]|uniref:efflux transporter outer membrane subunit n=1 Tax=unclassified Burkholderia TaxID=2613784 RepID=UPI00158E2880|nr:efflux transporter outer membrane subunit [Burkholderia sp. BCC0322]